MLDQAPNLPNSVLLRYIERFYPKDANLGAYLGLVVFVFFFVFKYTLFLLPTIFRIVLCLKAKSNQVANKFASAVPFIARLGKLHIKDELTIQKKEAEDQKDLMEKRYNPDEFDNSVPGLVSFGLREKRLVNWNRQRVFLRGAKHLNVHQFHHVPSYDPAFHPDLRAVSTKLVGAAEPNPEASVPYKYV